MVLGFIDNEIWVWNRLFGEKGGEICFGILVFFFMGVSGFVVYGGVDW